MSNHYYTPKESNSIEIKRYEILDKIRGHLFKFISYSTVFSKDRVDKGSKFFAENMIVLDNVRVLDLGCGYGIFGIVYSKTCESCDVTLLDINPYAIKAAKYNIKINQVNAKAILSNLFEKIDNEKFDIILTYPPYSAGKSIVKKFITQSYNHLENKGILQLLTTNLYSYSIDIVKRVFDRYSILGKRGRYKIVIGIKN